MKAVVKRMHYIQRKKILTEKLKEKKCRPRILCPEKMSFKNKREIKILSVIDKSIHSQQTKYYKQS